MSNGFKDNERDKNQDLINKYPCNIKNIKIQYNPQKNGNALTRILSKILSLQFIINDIRHK